MASKLFNSVKIPFVYKEIENLSKIIYFLLCIFSLISIFFSTGGIKIARNYQLLFG